MERHEQFPEPQLQDLSDRLANKIDNKIEWHLNTSLWIKMMSDEDGTIERTLWDVMDYLKNEKA